MHYTVNVSLYYFLEFKFDLRDRACNENSNHCKKVHLQYIEVMLKKLRLQNLSVQYSTVRGNSSSALTRPSERTHTRADTCNPGCMQERLGVRCLARGHFSQGRRGAVHSLPNPHNSLLVQGRKPVASRSQSRCSNL